MKLKLIHATLFSLCCVVATPGAASGMASSAGSSASEAGSSALGGSSDSLGTSSDSSGEDTKVAAGDYRLAAINPVADQQEMLRLTMEPLDTTGDASSFHLDLPRLALKDKQLNPGETIRVLERSYGLEFAHGAKQEPFFLVLADDWQRDLGSRVVTN